MLKWPAYVIVTSPESESAPRHSVTSPGSQAAATHSLSLRLSGEGRGTVKAKAPLAPLGGSPVRVMSMKLYIFLSSLKADERMRVNLSCSLLLVLSYSTINK